MSASKGRLSSSANSLWVMTSLSGHSELVDCANRRMWMNTAGHNSAQYNIVDYRTELKYS